VFDTAIGNIALPTARHALSSFDANFTLFGGVFVPFISMPDNEGVFEDNDVFASDSKTVLNDFAEFSPLLKDLRV
jgi:hypothetical protein